VAGAAQPLPFRSGSDSPHPCTRGIGGDRNERHGQSAAVPVLTARVPREADGEARRSVRASALPSRWGAGTRPGCPAVRGAVQRQRGISRCTDRSAGGYADWRTVVTTRARAFHSPDAAEASSRRRVSWRSRGRWWRGPAARATVRPCHISALPAGPLPQAAARYPWETWLGREPQLPAPPLCQCCLGRPQRPSPRTRRCTRQGLSTCAGEKGTHGRANC